jgi:hypothetical protein
MKSQAEPAHPLPAKRAFLVQVHATAEVAQGRLAGRVEHVVSGRATHFASSEELLAFMARVLPPCLCPAQSPTALPQDPSQLDFIHSMIEQRQQTTCDVACREHF